MLHPKVCITYESALKSVRNSSNTDSELAKAGGLTPDKHARGKLDLFLFRHLFGHFAIKGLSRGLVLRAKTADF